MRFFSSFFFRLSLCPVLAPNVYVLKKWNASFLSIYCDIIAMVVSVIFLMLVFRRYQAVIMSFQYPFRLLSFTESLNAYLHSFIHSFSSLIYSLIHSFKSRSKTSKPMGA